VKKSVPVLSEWPRFPRPRRKFDGAATCRLSWFPAMPASKFTHHDATDIPSSVVREEHIETSFLGKLQSL
jgi:hypothetical protein